MPSKFSAESGFTGRFPAANPASDQWLCRAGNGHAATGVVPKGPAIFVPSPYRKNSSCCLKKVSSALSTVGTFGDGDREKQVLSLKGTIDPASAS